MLESFTMHIAPFKQVTSVLDRSLVKPQCNLNLMSNERVRRERPFTNVSMTPSENDSFHT